MDADGRKFSEAIRAQVKGFSFVFIRIHLRLENPTPSFSRMKG
jgi:hypothetical protein